MRLLPKPRRIIAETLMKHALASKGLETEPHLYNHDKLRLHSMSITTMFNLILVSPWPIYQSNAYSASGQRTESPSNAITACLELLFIYQKLVSDTMFFPICDVDGKDAVLQYEYSGNQTRVQYLKTKCAEYIQAVDSVCVQNVLAKKELDKPNIHRLLELYNHTIPLLGHVRQVQELLFEAAHQPLKRGLRKSNYRDAHITAMDIMLANDWKYRLCQTLRAYNITDSRELSNAQCIKLKHVRCGDIDTENNSGREQQIAARVRDCFKPPVMDPLLSVVDEHEVTIIMHWIPFELQKEGNFNFSPIIDTKAAVKYLSHLYERHIENGGTIRRAMYAKSVHRKASPTLISTVTGKSPKENIHVIRRSDVVQAAVKAIVTDTPNSNTESVRLLNTQEEFVNCLSAPSSFRKFWLVLDIISLEKQKPQNELTAETQSMFGVVWPVSLNRDMSSAISKYYKAYSVTQRNNLFVLPLKESVRKVMTLHLCNWNETATCSVTPHGQSCLHSGSIAEGELFLLFGSVEGFPTREG